MSRYMDDHEHEIMRDEIAAQHAERDRQREPGPVRYITERRAHSRLIDTTIVALACPCCNGRVFVPADSDREAIDCMECGAQLVTKRDVDGVSVVEREGGHGPIDSNEECRCDSNARAKGGG